MLSSSPDHSFTLTVMSSMVVVFFLPWLLIGTSPNVLCDASPLYVSDIKCMVCSQAAKMLIEDVDRLNTACLGTAAEGKIGDIWKSHVPKWAECVRSKVELESDAEDAVPQEAVQENPSSTADSSQGEEIDVSDEGTVKEDTTTEEKRVEEKQAKELHEVTHLSKDTIWHLMTNQFKEGEGSKEEDDEVENICRILIKKYTVKPKSQGYDTGSNKDWKFIPNIHYENRRKDSEGKAPNDVYGNSIEVSKKLMKACQKYFQTETLLELVADTLKDIRFHRLLESKIPGKDRDDEKKSKLRMSVEEGCKRACPFAADEAWIRDEL